jgi:hypothetical protein
VTQYIRRHPSVFINVLTLQHCDLDKTDIVDVEEVLILTPLATVIFKPQFRIGLVRHLEDEVNI